MAKFYFTYGTDGTQPFKGGWTEVIAPDAHTARQLFQVYHPDRTPGILNCCWVYSEEAFAKTEMAKQGGNFGAGCWEVICLTKKQVLTFVGKDNHDRPVYVDPGHKLYVDTDPRKDREPQICTKYQNLFDGEPRDPVSGNFEFYPNRVTWD